MKAAAEVIQKLSNPLGFTDSTNSYILRVYVQKYGDKGTKDPRSL